MTILGVYALSSMASIGGEIEDLTEKIVPLQAAVQEIEINQLEQVICLEQAFRWGEIEGDHAAAKFEESVAAFHKLAHLVDEEMLEAEAMIQEATYPNEGRAEEAATAMATLRTLEADHKTFERMAENTLAKLEAKHFEEAHKLEEQVEDFAHDMDASLEAFLGDLTASMGKRTLAAEEHEHRAEWILLALACALIPAGLFYGIRFVRLFAGLLSNLNVTVAEVAAGNLTHRIDQSRKDEMGDLAKDLNQFIGQVRDVITHIAGDIETVNRASHHVAQSSNMLSSAACQKAGSLDQISSSLGRVSDNVDQNNSSAQDATKLSSDAKVASNSVQADMATLSTAMEEISSSSNDIAGVIQVIEEIAFQTNLLALNAAVEASRAGEAGRGFAVVAEEVRNLAKRSADAASDTNNMIQTAIGRSENGCEVVGKVEESIGTILLRSSEIDEAIGVIASATSSQAENLSSISTEIVQLNNATQADTAVAEELAATSEETSAQCDVLQSLIKGFTIA
ncbi:MAG: methyl-accepting chemotaxis protein [Planctomycetota bacterium]|nr:methyl-accepting chemotaxis protein [Planctomycetota bacterium]